VTIGDATLGALVVYLSARFVAGILPADAPLGGGTVSVTYNGQPSAPRRYVSCRDEVWQRFAGKWATSPGGQKLQL
jgi:hypothetical protein